MYHNFIETINILSPVFLCFISLSQPWGFSLVPPPRPAICVWSVLLNFNYNVNYTRQVVTEPCTIINQPDIYLLRCSHWIKLGLDKQGKESEWQEHYHGTLPPIGKVHLPPERDAFRDHGIWIPCEFSVILAWPALEEHINLLWWFSENHSNLASN